MKLLVALVLLLALLVLVRRNLLRVDLSFPLFASIVVLGFAAINDHVIEFLAASLGIIYAPLAIILLAIFIILALVTFLAVAVSNTRQIQISLVRRLAEMELEQQEIMRPNSVSEK
jgi:hypothetical protein